MPISKKEINKEMMFNKIMPSGSASKKLAEANAIKESIHEAEKAEKAEVQELKNLGKAREKKTQEKALHADIKPAEKAVPDKPLTIAEGEKQKKESKPLVLNGDTAEDVSRDKKNSKRSKKKGAEKAEEQKAQENSSEENPSEENAENTQPESENADSQEAQGEEASENTDNAQAEESKTEEEKSEKSEESEKSEKAEKAEKSEPKPASNQPVMVNIHEKMVLEKVDAAISKFKCCSCYLCRQDIVTTALNSLKPKYIVAVEDDLPTILKKENYSEVTSAIMKAILHVKSNPRH